MHKLIFNTLDDEVPIFKVKNYKISCFLDTGANIPVWNGKLSSFLSTFKKCDPTKTDMIVNMGGFGEKTVQMEVYRINNFELADGKQRLVFKTLYIAIEESRKRAFDLLLTYSMFKNINILVIPLVLNRQIVLATNKQYVFDTSCKIAQVNKNGKEILLYTESYAQLVEPENEDSSNVTSNNASELIQSFNF